MSLKLPLTLPRSGALASSPKFLPLASFPYLRLTGTNGVYASSPDSAHVSVTGDLDIDVWVAYNSYTVYGHLLSKISSGTQRSYRFSVMATGKLRLDYSITGSAAISVDCSANIPATAGQGIWLRVTRVSASGAVKFYTSDDGLTWTQLGNNATNTAGSIFDGTSIVEVGASFAGTDGAANGKVYRARVFNGLRENGGTVVFDANFMDRRAGLTSFAENAKGATVTLVGAASIVAP